MTTDYEIMGLELQGELGRGAMGVVYKARQTTLNRVVAVKLLLAGEHADTLAIQRMRNEAETVAQLQHPNVVQIYEFGTYDGKACYVLEYAGGGNLRNHVADRLLPFPETAKTVETLARAMHVAHERGIVHRDLKPANILLSSDGTLKISDFGLAKRLADVSELTASGAIMGTPSYMAPEQAQGLKSIGPPADVYALGAILYELLSGNPPFRGTDLYETLNQVVKQEPVPPSRVNPKVPRDLETIALKCLQKDPARRYANARELAEDLARYNAGDTILARPPSKAEVTWKYLKKHRQASIATLAALCTLVAILIGYGIYSSIRRTRDVAAAIQRTNEALTRARETNKELDAERLFEEAQRQAAAALVSDPQSVKALENRFEVYRQQCEWLITKQKYDAARSLLPFLRDADVLKANDSIIENLRNRVFGFSRLIVSTEPPGGTIRFGRIQTASGTVDELASLASGEPLEPGAYLITASLPGYPNAEVPIALEREAKVELNIKLVKTVPPGMKYIPAGPALLRNPATGIDEVTHVPAYFIDRTEVTNEDYARFVKATGHRTPESWKEGRVLPHAAVHNVSWYDAMTYARWAGKRLPTNEQWEKAARGADGRLYPWGNLYEPWRCHGRDSHSTFAVGQFKPGESPFKVLDLAGNVWEWTLDAERPDSANRCFRGGASYSDAADLVSSRRFGGPPGGGDGFGALNFLGFRCVIGLDDEAPLPEVLDFLKTGPDFATAAEYYEAVGEPKMVETCVRKLIAMNPDSVAGNYWLGRTLFSTNEQAAMEAWGKCFRRRPNYRPSARVHSPDDEQRERSARTRATAVYAKLSEIGKSLVAERYDDAETALSDILKTDPTLTPALEDLAKVYAETRREPQAQELRRKCMDLMMKELAEHPEDAERWYLAADFAQLHAMPRTTVEPLILKAIALSPNTVAYSLKYAEILARAGSWDTARKYAEIALRLRPDDTDAQKLLRAIHEKRQP